MHQTENVQIAPMTAVSGTGTPRTRTLSGARNGRSSSGSLNRSTMTEMCAAVNEIMEPNAYTSASRVTWPGKMRITATAPKTLMAMNGVSRVGCTRPSARGSCRC